jgi:restriction endonuclease S subunit
MAAIVDSLSAARPGLSPELIARSKVPVPPPSERVGIADFLHRETAEIDELITLQQELMALLAERRSAAAARALDAAWRFPAVPLKRLFGQGSGFFGALSGDSGAVPSALAPSFADALLRSPRLVAEYRTRLHSSRPSWEQLRDIRVPVPPIPEQNEIVERLDRETAEIDSVIADAGEAIALSRERRAALISAAVTGKIDVRDAAAA